MKQRALQTSVYNIQSQKGTVSSRWFLLGLQMGTESFCILFPSETELFLHAPSNQLENGIQIQKTHFCVMQMQLWMKMLPLLH